MQSGIPKQFMLIKNKPILCHTINKFYSYDPEVQIILVVPRDQIDQCKDPLKSHDFKIPYRVVNGGSERFFSVKNGLNEIPDEGLVAIHDGVRPLVSIKVIRNAFNQAAKYGNAIPAVKVSESIRKKSKKTNKPVVRDDHYLIQTPQTFKVSHIKHAYAQNYRKEFTDDATVLESIGKEIHLIKGNVENIKITTLVDLKIAEALM